jgi:hypothetical protein
MRIITSVLCLALLGACNDKEDQETAAAPPVAEIAAQPVMPAEPDNELPPLNYRDEGQCPFEGCIYGDWVVEKPTVIYKDINSVETYFGVRPGDNIKAITGVVITKTLGRVEALKDVTLTGENNEKVEVRAGDVLYPLNYEGEGIWKIWYKGKMVYEGLDEPKTRINPQYTKENLLGLKTIKLPVYEWWVKIQNSEGLEGWTQDTENFGNNDRFG